MEYFTEEGTWWLPERPRRRISGTLTFDRNGLELVLYDSLREFVIPPGETVGVGAPQWEVVPIVHGRTRDGKDVTLFDLGGLNMAGPFDEVTESYTVSLAMTGGHTNGDSFTEAWFGYDLLGPWTDPPSIQPERRGRTVGLSLGTTDLGGARVGSDDVRLLCGVEGTSGDESVHLDQWTAFSVRLGAPLPWQEVVQGHGRVLHDFLTFVLGRPTRLTSFCLRAADTDPRAGMLKAYFAAVQPEETRGADVRNYSSPTLFLRRDSPVPLEELLPSWYELHLRLAEPIVLLVGPYYAPFIYDEHRYASTFQSVESLHGALYPSKQRSPAGHKARVEAVLSASRDAGVAEDDLTWAGNVLRARNDKPLKEKVHEVVTSTGDVGALVLGASPTFVETVASLRTGVSHGGAAMRKLPPGFRYWYGEALRWVLRTRLLIELGVPTSQAAALTVARAPFRHVLRQLPDVTPSSPPKSRRNTRA